MSVDRETYLEVMSRFPTGVAIVTTIDEEGRPLGFTSNAVTSVSADPPKLLVCVAKTSRSLPALLQRKGFLVNFMAAGSAAACGTFASKLASDQKFAATAWRPSVAGHPLLHEDSLAFADCETESEIDMGTHLVVVGAVVDGGVIEPARDPIAYQLREYRTLS